MPFISVSDGLIKKSTTSVENRFIIKYLPVLDPIAVKIYLYSLFLYQSGSSYSVTDLAQTFSITEDKAKEYFDYLEEFELVSIISRAPFEIKLLEAENTSGTPKKFKPEKYSDFTKTVQSILKGRMISSNEFMEYFSLLEDYGFEQHALIMIINYCVNLHGDKIRLQYIRKVAKSFAEEGATTAKKVDEKLAAYTSSTPALIALFNALGIKKQPDLDDDKLYKKWTAQLGFEDNAIITCAKLFKAKTCEKIDLALEELYKNRKFDVKEIDDYCKNKNSIYSLTLEIAKNLGVYMQNFAPYVENYVNPWCNFGFEFESLKKISNYCFRQRMNSFEDMHTFVLKLYNSGIVAEKSVIEHLETLTSQEKLLKELLSVMGLNRKVLPWDRESLAKWRSWNFSDEMLYEAAKLSAGKSNPTAYMNGVLSAWKAENVYTKDKIEQQTSTVNKSANNTSSRELQSVIERHYSDLRNLAEQRAETALASATSDKVYGGIKKKLNQLSIELAFAELSDRKKASEIVKNISELEILGDKRLSELCIDKADFTPKYACEICKDTGYDSFGKPCVCMKKFIDSLK